MDRKKILTGILAAVSILAGAVLFFGLYMDRKQQQQQAVQIARQNEQAKPYEEEIRGINEQMKEEKKLLDYLSDTAQMLVGYKIYVPDDLDMIQKQAEEYGFSPIVVLDCSMEIEELTILTKSVAEKGWEIMLTGSPVTEATYDTAAQVREVLGQSQVSDTGVFLLKSGDYSEETVDMLKSNGFKGYTCFSDTVTNGCTENGMVYFEYWYVQRGDASMATKLEQMTTDRKAMIVVFDLQSLHTGLLSKKSITERLDLMQSYVEQEKVVYASTAEIVGQLSDINAVKQQRQEEYDKYAAKQQEKIDELQKKVHKIYGR